jgi:2-polyprenyl-3-methyl-5-hydroxy-6-metoxy-1,4-benzoquinol methylase
MSSLKDQDTLVHFNERAANWNHLYQKPQFKDRLSLFVNAINSHVAPHSKVLDYGCGTGRIAMELAINGYQVLGVDGAREMIETARSEAINRELSSISFETIEPATWIPRQEFDAIVCSSVLEYVPNDQSLLNLFAKALVPGGTLLVSIPYKYSLIGMIKDCVGIYRNLISTNKHDIQYAKRRYSRMSFSQSLKTAGFTTPNWTSFELPAFNQFGVRLSRSPYLGVMMLADTKRLAYSDNQQNTTKKGATTQ